MLHFERFLHYINGKIFCTSKGGRKMKSDLELIGKFDSYIKKSLKNELKYCIREMKREHSNCIIF